ncbi:ABC transporter ATP-binding protein [Mycolicibacterium baixiangningiae]|uniref:ABC transporter ATP-binding protein n=1 Tax=Mycolicibacterium baixiangningiae TaxID=2761578 RepID=UPI0018D1BA27|nr:ABC transporter ATP-binding protein [Mycolicibacterium baixiangningiae]
MTDVALQLEDLEVSVDRPSGRVPVVTGVNLSVFVGEAVGVVGESGCGKSLTLRAASGILPRGAEISGGSVTYPSSTTGAPRIGIVFQDPAGALNPTRRVGDQIADGIEVADGLSRKQAREAAISLMTEVGIPDPERRAKMWPHELSGGLRQRVVIAMALSSRPDVLLCDEPTTALDVTVQDQILGLLDRLRRERGMALVFVTHDLAVVATLCTRVAVLYAGEIVELGDIKTVVNEPRHAYSKGLLDAGVTVGEEAIEFQPIPGQPPEPETFDELCRFRYRCALRIDRCDSTPVELVEVGPAHLSNCLRAPEIGADR